MTTPPFCQPSLLYLSLEMAVLPVVLCLPMHLLLRRLVERP
jgi:hypothetical protein